MAKKRKPLSDKVRFEVFKRDGFKCQYCGRSLPEVILEVDHIVPVAEGGENDMMNLITSCRECNRGKGKIPLDDETILKKQKAELEELNEKRNQMEMMIQWRTELRSLDARQVDAINELIISMTGYELYDSGKRDVLDFLKRFGFNEVYEATEISFRRYYKGDDYSFNKALSKIGGVCYNRRKQGEV